MLFNRIKRLTDARSSLGNVDISDLVFSIDDETRARLQNVLLDMYKDLLSVCNRYGIIPYLIGGSALGAVRHQGFIPWDDDLDVGMTRSDYETFVSVFEKELSDKYILNAPHLSERVKTRFTKIFKKDTIFREISDGDEGSVNGIFLDVFIIENVPRNAIVRKIKGTYCNCLQFISSQVYLYENNNSILEEMYTRSGDNYRTRMWIGRLFSYRTSTQWFNRVDRSVRNKETGLYGIVTGRKHYFGEIFEANIFFPVQYIRFCDIDAPVFNNMDLYLKNLYGDYMKIPPEDKREKHSVREISF